MKYAFQWKAILVGLLFLVVGGYRLTGILRAQSWMEKDAVMDKAELVPQPSSSGTTFRLDVTYHWEHEGKTYTGHEFSMDGTLAEESPTVLKEKAAPWVSSPQVKCLMNPRNPAQAVLRPAKGLDTQIVLVVLGVLLLLWGAVWPVWVVRRSQRPDGHRRFPAEGYAMAGIVLILGVTMGGLVFEEWSARQQTSSWVPVPCLVLESRVVRVKGEFRPLIRYEWDMEGQTHEGQTTSASTFHGSIFDVEKLVAEFPARMPALCWVNPAAPAQAVLEREPPLRGWAWWLGIAGLMGACSWRFARCWKHWRMIRSAEALAEEPGQISGLSPRKPRFTREAYLTLMANLPLITGLIWIVGPCAVVLVWLLPIAHRELQYSVLFTPAQLACFFGGAILLAALLSMGRRLWRA